MHPRDLDSNDSDLCCETFYTARPLPYNTLRLIYATSGLDSCPNTVFPVDACLLGSAAPFEEVPDAFPLFGSYGRIGSRALASG